LFTNKISRFFSIISKVSDDADDDSESYDDFESL